MQGSLAVGKHEQVGTSRATGVVPAPQSSKPSPTSKLVATSPTSLGRRLAVGGLRRRHSGPVPGSTQRHRGGAGPRVLRAPLCLPAQIKRQVSAACGPWGLAACRRGGFGGTMDLCMLLLLWPLSRQVHCGARRHFRAC